MIERIKKVVAWIFIVCLLGLLLGLLYGELQLYVKHAYTIATVRDIYRGKIGFTYTVEGIEYEKSATWYRKARVGERYVIKYAVNTPYGNDFLFDQPVPDSIHQAAGEQWQQFLRNRNLY